MSYVLSYSSDLCEEREMLKPVLYQAILYHGKQVYLAAEAIIASYSGFC